MSPERSVKDLSGLYTLDLERAMGIEPTSEAWDAIEHPGRPSLRHVSKLGNARRLIYVAGS